MAPAASFVQIRPQSVVMTAMYRHGQAVVLRMYESHGERSQVELTLPFEVGVAEESDFYGDRLDPGTPITVAERQVSFAIQPWQIVTLYVRPVSKPRANAKGSE